MSLNLLTDSPSTVALSPIQNKIQSEIHRFELYTLLKLLRRLGYPPEEIYFKSNPDLASFSSLCQEIHFAEEFPRVTLVLNLGLLSANSPLPNLFRKKMDTGSIDPVLFSRFLSFFDHFTVRNLIFMGMPEANLALFSDWKETEYRYLHLLGLNSSSTLWHFFQLCFPELNVQVKKVPRVISTQSVGTILGYTLLGKESFLGKKDKITISIFKIFLTAEAMNNDQELFWPTEIKKRLQQLLFPILERVNLYYQVILVIKNVREAMRLSVDSQLGYGSIGISKNSLRLLIFSKEYM